MFITIGETVIAFDLAQVWLLACLATFQSMLVVAFIANRTPAVSVRRRQAVLMALLMTPALVASTLLHEAGHVVSALSLGHSVIAITTTEYGYQTVVGPLDQLGPEIGAIFLAGPLVNVLLAVGCLRLSSLARNARVSLWLTGVAFFNAYLGLLNLFAPGTDGARAFAILLKLLAP